MQVEDKIFGVLLDNAEKKLYLSQIARISGASGSTCHKILEKKVKENLIKKEKLGNLSLYFINSSNSLVRQQKVTRAVKLLKPLVEKLSNFSEKIILFGSAAEGTDTAESDIDLFILTNGKDSVCKIISRLKVRKRIHFVIKNYLEWLEIKDKNKLFFEELKKGRILWEEHYGG